ncbi:MAG: threonine--tRNA ligase, partial [Candidatus Parcubacteria bacterium]|nr:threonine--tRNA ligase [Candidatus Parcubacteria bacterium]
MAIKNDIEVIRHSTSHLLAAAVLELFPETKFGIGPVITNGFYYDFDLPRTLTPEDLPKIEQKMRQLIKHAVKFARKEMSTDEAIEMFKKINQNYKVELLEDIKNHGTTKLNEEGEHEMVADKNNIVSVYQTGGFIDLCRGPHVNSTQSLGAFKLTKIAGAYWRGNEKNKMLQRVYGVAFAAQKELDDYLKLLEEAEKRDHRRIGKDLDLFSIDDYVGPGLVLWHPKLSIVREEIELYWRKEHRKRGYQYVYTPHIGLSNLWETSGHLETFQEGMYPPMSMIEKDAKEKTKYYIKPMNCPFHIRIYKSQLRSYRDLPMRLCELGSVYRSEKSGVLHGMLRVRGFTQDDAHIFCTPDQIEEQILEVVDFVDKIMKTFDFNYKMMISTKPEKAVGDDAVWEISTNALKNAMDKNKLA